MSGQGFQGPLPPDAFNMARYAIGHAADATPDKIALEVFDRLGVGAGERWSYRALEDAVLRSAAAFGALGLTRGDRVLVHLPNTSRYATAFFGAIAGGVIPIPVSDQLTERELAFLQADSGAALMLSDTGAGYGATRTLSGADFAEVVNAVAPSDYAATLKDEPAYLVYTSGTTSEPKGVLHAHRAAWGRRPMYAGWYGLSAPDRMLHAGAFNWTYTLGTGLTDPWACGATAIVFTGVKEPTLWPQLIRETGATIFAAVPGVYRQMLKYARDDIGDLGALRHGLMAGEQPPADLLEIWRAATGRPLYEALGMSEISTYVSTSPEVAPRAGAAGKPQPGRAVAILIGDDEDTMDAPRVAAAGETGLLAVHRSDPGLMLRYWNRPEEDAAVRCGDWFIGGDLAMIDADGYVHHRGRVSDVMNAGGYRVSPAEVEAVLAAHPDVLEAACAEVEVRPGVHVICAFVVAHEDCQSLAADVLVAHAGQHLAPYKTPRAFRFVETLPRTRNGKVRRSELPAWFQRTDD